MLKMIYRTVTKTVLTVMVFIYVVLEELVWERIAEPIYGYIRELKVLHKLEFSVLKLNRYVLLIFFLLLFVVVELLGVIAIGLFAQGQVMVGTLLYAAKIPIAAFTFWVFKIAQAKLMTFAWFKFCYEGLLALLHKIKTSAIYVNIRAKATAMKMWLNKLSVREHIRRIKLVLGFKSS